MYSRRSRQRPLDAVMLKHAEPGLLDSATSHIAKCTSSIQALEHRHRRSPRWKGRCSDDDDFLDVRRSLETDSPWRDGGSFIQGTYATSKLRSESMGGQQKTIELQSRGNTPVR
jgi:hypothetical protein